MPEPLVPLARAVFYEVQRLEEELGVELGEVRLDVGSRTVLVEGVGLRSWGPRTMLEARLSRCGLRFDVHVPNVYIVIYPA